MYSYLIQKLRTHAVIYSCQRFHLVTLNDCKGKSS